MSNNNFTKENINKPIARWTIGQVKPDGFKCLVDSINNFKKLYDVEIVICYNCDINNLPDIVSQFRLIDQQKHIGDIEAKPKGVSWKLYPPRLDINRHELFIDNDMVIINKIPQIDEFFKSDCTLLLEDTSRTYGRFEKHVPPNKFINSGIFGIPPKFDMKNFIDFYVGSEWENNASHEHAKNITWDEQGLVALALLNYHKNLTIPNTCITNCEHHLVNGKGLHFVALNRRNFHSPFRLWHSRNCKIHL